MAVMNALFRFGHRGWVPVGDVAAIWARFVEVFNRLFQRVAEELDAADVVGVELRVVGAAGGAAGDFEDGLVLIVERFLGLGVGPAALPGEGLVFGPDAEGESERPYFIVGDGGVDRELATGNLFLDEAIGVFTEVGVPEGVIADLEAVFGEELEFGEAPGGFLAVDALVSEEGVASGGGGEDAEDGGFGPVGVLAVEVEPDAHGAVGGDFEFAVLLDIAELARGGVVEDEDDWAQAFGEVDLFVEDLLHGDRAVAVVIHGLEVRAEAVVIAAPAPIALFDEVIFQHRNAAQLIGRPCGRGG